MIVACTAFHWFDMSRFHAEAEGVTYIELSHYNTMDEVEAMLRETEKSTRRSDA